MSESWSVEEDDETVKARAYLNKGSVSDSTLAVDASTCREIKGGSHNVKRQHVRWHVMRPHLPHGPRARPLSLFAENEFTARD